MTITRDGMPAKLTGTHLLLAAGRKANVENLGLDAAGGHQFTHVAEHHAGIVLRRSIFRMKWAKPSPVVPWCTYTDPEFARVGLSESEAKQQGVAHRVYRFPLDDIDRARAEGETEGMAKLVTARNGRLLGAAIVAPHAGELIAECALAMSQKLKAGDLSATIHTYPTLSMVTRRAADQRMKEGLTPSSKGWIKRLFGLQGA
jgi:pyruvate/2-oxoglutarate dehydrogenase complex dihydrolipoamide dehydrogenase (E3) component